MEPDDGPTRQDVAMFIFGGLMAHHNPGVQHEPTKLAAAARFAFVAADIFLAEARDQQPKQTP